jgi:hypothetical protein
VQSQPHISFARILVCAALAVLVAVPGASAQPKDAQCRVQIPSGLLVRVPCPPGAASQHESPLNSSAKSSRLHAARAQQRYYTSYGNRTQMIRPSVPAADGGIDWTAIGIAIGATCLLAGALIALVMRTRRRTGRVRAVA